VKKAIMRRDKPRFFEESWDLWGISLIVLVLLAISGPVNSASWGQSPLLQSDIEVKDQDGRRLNFYGDLVRGRTVLISFMFTGCKTVCPPQTAMLSDVRTRLNASSTPLKNVLLISLTVDPLGDGPEQLKAFAKKFELTPNLASGWVFLTGEAPQILKLLKSLEAGQSNPADHPELIWLGNDVKKRWARSAGFNSPEQIVKLLEEAQR
jgi:protein SCO1